MVESTDHEEEIDVETELHEAEGSIVKGWPAVVLAVIMVAAAVYAFSPRPHPDFPPTEVKADQLMTNGLAVQGSRHIAVGELGIILIADQAGGPWRRAKVEPQRGSNLTKVQFIGDNTAIAVGHSGWLLRSEDGGESWRELAFNENSADPLLGIGGPFEGAAAGKLFAFGAFGQFMVSKDSGQTWKAGTLTMAEVEEEEEEVEEAAATEDADADFDPFASGSEDYDPFAEFESGGMAEGYSTRHFYAMTQVADGSLFLVGERGMVLRSTDGGKTWKASEEIYTGSFYGLSEVPGGLLVYGMRGNAFLSRDQGATWSQSNIPLIQGLYASAVDDEGTVVLVGASNTILVSRDGGENFKKVSRRGPFAISSILSLDDGGWLMAGEGGIGNRNVLKSVPPAKGEQS